INELNSNFGGLVLDNRYYAGGCLPHFIQDVRFRKPYNIQQYTLEASLSRTCNTTHLITKGSYDYKQEFYDSYTEFSEHTMKASKSRTTVSFAFGIPGIFNIGYNLDISDYKKSVQKLHSYAGKTNSFIHAHIQLEVVRYALKADNLILHSEFMSRLRTLPLEYTYGEYRQLYSDYGTHYITEAKLGGTFDHTLILNKENIEKSKYSLNDAKSCLQQSFNLGINIKGVYVSGGFEGGYCDGLLKEFG
ncbi:complement component C8 beta chain, partial [Tachysurus ichikawai]